ncbi:PEP-CTERM sorting domain-containing protein [Piscinibacter koreensis]|uniref:PEP-CTERM sorting domain-containing protein n=1 Tax=Piscinibacter koreensis TaxID=2742824 RepID=A0A7Y6TZ90_9BURK|nr:PEP-CTERM sorting domain-containing protein [Schlegelella koreensis]NUZ08856.1 PEP-CTERM sorting domain-containing protein [Schlegelella koreensis]
MNWLAVTALSAAFAAAPALAAPITIDFEGVTSFAPIADYYNAGRDGAGVAGPALAPGQYGVSFAGDALALQNDVLGPYFSNAPSPLGVMFPAGTAATLNSVGGSGFVGTLSFYYSSATAVANAVQLWSGLDGTGALLASFDLAANAQQGGCSDSSYCNFGLLSGSFAGIAHSVTFGNAAGFAAFDNVGINVVPEPATALLLALGLGGLAATRRRR